MTRYWKLGLCLAAFVPFAVTASAQKRAALRPGVRRAPAMGATRSLGGRTAPRPVIIRVPLASPPRRANLGSSASFSASGTSFFANPAAGFIPSGATSFDIGQLLNNVPGLGFNYEFLNAMNQNLGERAFIDPVTQQDLALAERLSRASSGFSGFVPLWGGGYYGEAGAAAPEAPAVIIEPEPQAQASPPESPSESSGAPAEEPAPLPDVGPFILVLHSGEKITAVAFTRQSDQIVYITKDGLRQSFPASDLDAAATRQMNQQRGTPLELPL